MIDKRIGALLRICQEHALDAALIGTAENMRYFTGGYTGEGMILLGRQGRMLLTDSRYTEQAQHQAQGFDVVEYANSSEIYRSLQGCCGAMGARRIYIDALHTTIDTFQSLQALQGLEFVPCGDFAQQIRMIKDDAELACIAQACEITDAAFERVLELSHVGISEKQLANELIYWISKTYGVGCGFDFIIASGINGSMPHAVLSDKPLAVGELVTIDFGVEVQGYRSDMTRTYALGKPCEQLCEIYSIVRKAQSVSQSGLCPGMRGCEAHAIAADIISAAGYGEYFGHGLGHGVGLEIHELPRLAPSSQIVLAENMVVTVEPGIYIPALGGVRIENTCKITENGAQSLFKSTTEMVIL